MKIKMRMIVRFPGYAIETDTAHYRRASAHKLKREFNGSTEQEYLVLLKVIGQHENHDTGEVSCTAVVVKIKYYKNQISMDGK